MNKFLYLLPVVLLSLFTFSCKEETDITELEDSEILEESLCIITKETSTKGKEITFSFEDNKIIRENSEKEIIATYEYDDNNLINKILYYSEGNESYSHSYTRSDKMIEVEASTKNIKNDSWDNEYKIIYYLNEDGLIDTLRKCEKKEESEWTLTSEFTTYEWVNGNLIKSIDWIDTENEPVKKFSTFYEYSHKANPYHYISFNGSMAPDKFFTFSKNLLTKKAILYPGGSKNVQYYEFEFNDKGTPSAYKIWEANALNFEYTILEHEATIEYYCK